MRFFRNQKDLDFLQPDIKIDVVDRGDFKEVKMFSNVFTRAVYLSVSDSDLLHFSDNFFDLYPSEPYSVSVRTDISASELERRLRVNTINDYDNMFDLVNIEYVLLNNFIKYNFNYHRI